MRTLKTAVHPSLLNLFTYPILLLGFRLKQKLFPTTAAERTYVEGNSNTLSSLHFEGRSDESMERVRITSAHESVRIFSCP